jgi:hypothetical protein
MSKGFIRVGYYLDLIVDTENNNTAIINQFASNCVCSYVPKHSICGVEKLVSFKQTQQLLRSFCGNYDCVSWILECAINSIFGSNYFKCTCGTLDKLNTDLKKGEGLVIETSHECPCWNQHFPLYLITVQNKHIASSTDDCGSEKVILPTTTYFVHPSEHEHMERFLAGTDDALYDYVHHLQFNPNNGTDVNAAKAEFESVLKKQKC